MRSLRAAFVVATACLSTHALAASSVTFEGPVVERISGAGRTVPIYGEAAVTLDDGEARRVHLTGAGLREKRVVVNVAVYVASSYIVGDEGISANDPLASIDASTTKVLQLTIVRNITGREIAGAFTESLQANGVNANEPAIQAIFQRLPQQVPAGSVVTFIGSEAANGEEHVRVEIPGGVIDSTGPDLALKMWKIWFGVPSDQGLARLKGQLIGGH